MRGPPAAVGGHGAPPYPPALRAPSASFVHWYEEPAPTRRFGAEYGAHRGAVPARTPRTPSWSPHE